MGDDIEAELAAGSESELEYSSSDESALPSDAGFRYNPELDQYQIDSEDIINALREAEGHSPKGEVVDDIALDLERGDYSESSRQVMHSRSKSMPDTLDLLMVRNMAAAPEEGQRRIFQQSELVSNFDEMLATPRHQRN